MQRQGLERIAGLFVLDTLAVTAWVALAPLFRPEPVMDCGPVTENGRILSVPVA